MRLSGRQSRPSCAHALWVTSTTNINEVLEGHVSLEIESLDRIYLHGYVPNLMVAVRWSDSWNTLATWCPRRVRS